MNNKSLGQILKAMGAVDDTKIDKALEYAETNSCRIGEAFVKLEACPQKIVSKAVARHYGLPFADLGKAEVKQAVISLVPKDVAIEHSVVPVLQKNGKLYVAMSEFDLATVDDLRFLLNQDIVVEATSMVLLQNWQAR